MKKINLILLNIFIALLITGCAKNVSPNTYTGSEVGVVSKIKKGVVISKRAVTIDNSSGAGGLAGVTAGAAGGSTLGGRASTNVMGAVGGAVVGGLIGNALDKGVNSHQGFEYLIKLDEDGQMISIVQTADVQFNPQQHVIIIYGAMTRLVADENRR